MFILNNSVIMSKISCYRPGCIIIKTGVFLTPQGISLEMYKNGSIYVYNFCFPGTSFSSLINEPLCANIRANDRS